MTESFHTTLWDGSFVSQSRMQLGLVTCAYQSRSREETKSLLTIITPTWHIFFFFRQYGEFVPRHPLKVLKPNSYLNSYQDQINSHPISPAIPLAAKKPMVQNTTEEESIPFMS